MCTHTGPFWSNRDDANRCFALLSPHTECGKCNGIKVYTRLCCDSVAGSQLFLLGVTVKPRANGMFNTISLPLLSDQRSQHEFKDKHLSVQKPSQTEALWMWFKSPLERRRRQLINMWTPAVMKGNVEFDLCDSCKHSAEDCVTFGLGEKKCHNYCSLWDLLLYEKALMYFFSPLRDVLSFFRLYKNDWSAEMFWEGLKCQLLC